MPEMVTLEKLFCRSAPWRYVARSVVLPWAINGVQPCGDVLEVGGGSGAMAAAIAERHPDVHVTTTDFDPAMVAVAADRLAHLGERAAARQADAAALPFPDASYDTALSFLMLHHVGNWPAALGELTRVLRPGGVLAGYDLLNVTPVRMVHRLERADITAATSSELRKCLDELELHDVRVRVSAAGLLARFTARKS